MKCEEFEMLMADALGGELDAAGRGELESHLAECASCRGEYAAAQSVLVRMRSLPGPLPRIGARGPFERAPQAPKYVFWRKSAPLLRLAAAVVIAFTAGYAVRGVANGDGPRLVSTGDDMRSLPGRPAVEAASFQSALIGVYRSKPTDSDLAKCMNALFKGRR